MGNKIPVLPKGPKSLKWRRTRPSWTILVFSIQLQYRHEKRVAWTPFSSLPIYSYQLTRICLLQIHPQSPNYTKKIKRWHELASTEQMRYSSTVWCGVSEGLPALWKTWQDMMTWECRGKKRGHIPAGLGRREWDPTPNMTRAIWALSFGAWMASNIWNKARASSSIRRANNRKRIGGGTWSTNRHARWREIRHVYASYFPGISGSTTKARLIRHDKNMFEYKNILGFERQRRTSLDPFAFAFPVMKGTKYKNLETKQWKIEREKRSLLDKRLVEKERMKTDKTFPLGSLLKILVSPHRLKADTNS